MRRGEGITNRPAEQVIEEEQDTPVGRQARKLPGKVCANVERSKRSM